ncbi:MAG: mechanosensitive ion channel family protein [Acidobacteriota bacterium]
MLGIDWLGLLQYETTWRVIRAVLLVIAGLIAVRVARSVLKRVTADRLSRAHSLLLRRLVTTTLLGLTLASALQNLGMQLSVLFGAAGIVTLALGFASQTSASNLIAGIFLIGDDTFSIGDVISVGGTTGEVVGIDLLSVKLRKFDNVLVRIPNETLIKTQVETLTRYPIRRIQLSLTLPFDESVEKLTEALFAAADRDPLLLEEPAPVVTYSGFGESGLELAVFVWAARENFLTVKNNLQANILDEIRARELRLAVNEVRVELSSVDPAP